MAFSLKDQLKKQQKSVKSRALKPPKTTSHYSAKNRWNQRQEVSNFSLDPQHLKKKFKEFHFPEGFKKLRDNREKLSTLCYARPRIWPRPRAIPPKHSKTKIIFQETKKNFIILTTNLWLSKKNLTIKLHWSVGVGIWNAS